MKTSDPDDIHDLRVSSRRFRAALELLYPVVPKGSRTELKRNICKLTRKLGGLRNIDEALSFFQLQTGAEAPFEMTLCPSLAGLRNGEFKRIEKALKAFDQRALDRLVRELVAGLNQEFITQGNSISLLAYFSDVSIRLYLPIHQLLTVSTKPDHRTSRHALRIAIKKWRYFFEIIAQVLDRDYTIVLEMLKEYQSLLGRMNDVSVFEDLIGSLSLSRDEREQAAAILRAEDARLFEEFTELVERKPLAYTFLI
jgi:CHAD domain-containing protein